MAGDIWEAGSYVVAVFGSIVLWVSYALFGLITRRYRQVFGRATFSTLVMLAPSGLLVYTLFLLLKATPLLENPQLAAPAQWVAYLSLFLSGLLCLIGVGRFSRVLSHITHKTLAEAGDPASGDPGVKRP